MLLVVGIGRRSQICLLLVGGCQKSAKSAEMIVAKLRWLRDGPVISRLDDGHGLHGMGMRKVGAHSAIGRTCAREGEREGGAGEALG